MPKVILAKAISPKVISLYLPRWSTDRWRRKTAGDAALSADTPLVLIGRQGNRRVVLATDAAAERAGLRVGMAVTKAQALVPDLVIKDADPVADAEALERLAVWALRYAPIVAADSPNGLVIDATGATHFFGSMDAALHSSPAGEGLEGDAGLEPSPALRGRAGWGHSVSATQALAACAPSVRCADISPAERERVADEHQCQLALHPSPAGQNLSLHPSPAGEGGPPAGRWVGSSNEAQSLEIESGSLDDKNPTRLASRSTLPCRGGMESEAMLTDIVTRLAGAGITARAAMAEHWGAAHGFARTLAKPIFVAPSGESDRLLEKLPIIALRLPHDMVAGLRQLGFETIGDLTSKPRAPLTLRFGPELGRRLDQAMGRLCEPIDPVRPPDLIEVQQVFMEPIGAPETLNRYTTKLVGLLCEALEQKGLGVRRLDLLFQRVDNRTEAIRIGTATPVRDIKRLSRLLCAKIETVDPGFGIELMRLAATSTEPFTIRQTVSELAEESEPDVSGLIDTLANRVGEKALYRIAPVASDVPERSVGRVPPTAPVSGEGWPSHWPRPTRLLTPPEPIETLALLPDHPPVSFNWRGIRHRVRSADGPERIFGEWWKRDVELSAVRDYFRVENADGERFWIFRAGDGEDAATGSHRWFLHGIFA